ncbi:MAG: hypothetical protein HY735_28795 [Verrucomicrobia bacterium]|nr:hypothetical protein [Verrucomicrobiota bacterium]
MRWIPISQAAAGMVLAEPVMDSCGRLLADKGESLSTQSIGVLHDHGIREVLANESEDTSNAPRLDESTGRADIEEAAVAVRRNLDVRFRKFPENPLMQTLRRLAEKHLVQAKLSNPERPSPAPAPNSFPVEPK